MDLLIKETLPQVFEMVAADEPIVCPKYIEDALEWLQTQLEPSKEVMP